MLLKKLYRFIEIDFQYLSTNLPLGRKCSDILGTNVQLCRNVLSKNKKYAPVSIGSKKIYYDTQYATKTLLTTIYDFYTETKYASLLSNMSTVVDIGANIGQFIIAVKAFYPNAKIYSCEPDKQVFTILQKNASQYKDVKVYNYGLSNRSGIATFYRSKAFSEWSGLKPLEGNEYEKVQIDLKKGDDLFKKLKTIDLLKVDVEGAELEVLKGLKKTLKKSKYVLLEASILRNPSDIGSTKVLSYLFENSFSINHIGRIFSDNSGKYQGAFDVLLKNDKYE